MYLLLKMITNAQIKAITSLQEKKYRNQTNSFVVEGRKMAEELLRSDYEIINIFALNTWTLPNTSFAINKVHKNIDEKITYISEKELERISSLKTPDDVLCIVKQKKTQKINLDNQLVLALDNINNPGNLGTIIRLATWFGVKNIICNENTVDCYNQKVLQSTMGAIFHVNLFYTNLYQCLQSHTSQNIYGTVLQNGKNIYNEALTNEGIIVIGNESHGISKDILQMINRPITIPCFAKENEIESLNASVACGVILSEFKRQTI